MVRTQEGLRCWLPALAALLIAAVPMRAAQAQGAVISGTVTVEAAAGETARPLPASVVITSLNLSVSAGQDGRYTLTVPAAESRGQQVRITARSLGYEPMTRTVTLNAGPQQLNFALKADPFRLSDIVVSGTADGQSLKKLPFSVAVVNEASMKDVPASSPVAALAGKVAGARIAMGTGNPGAAPAIRLRGSTSLGVGNSTPLIILDGVITRSSLADIDAQDIASIEVLKGAAASAFYGSDAANGVLSITTRRGKDIEDGDVRMSVRSEYGTTGLENYVPLNEFHYYETNPDGSFQLSGAGAPIVSADGIADNPYSATGPYRFRNQLKEWIPDGDFYSTNFQLGFRRGNTNLNSSFTSDRNSGIIPFRSGMFRQSARVNVDQGINTKADISTSITYSLTNNDYDPGSSDGWFALLQAPGALDLRNPNQDPTQDEFFPVLPSWSSGSSRGNPLYQLRNEAVERRRERLLGSATLRYRPVDWLRLEGSYGTDRSNTRDQTYQFRGYLNGSGVPGQGSLAIGTGQAVAENMQVNAIATKLFGSLLSTTRLTYLVEKQTNDGLNASGNNLLISDTPDLNSVDNDANSIGSSRSQRGAVNYMLSQAVDYQDKYIADLLVRRDGSSLFGAENRYADFYRAAFAWRFTEDFALPGIQEGRIRAARGTAGLRPGFADQYETYSLSAGQVSKNQLGNRELKPAIQTEDEIGLNLTFLDRFDGEIVFASRRTEDAFLNVPLSQAQSGGFQTQVQNAATVSAKTFELSLQARIIDRPEFSYSVGLTADRTRQKIDKMDRAPFRVNAGGQGQNVFYYEEGATLGIVFGHRWVRSLGELADNPAGLDPSLYVVNSDGYVVLASQHNTPAERPVRYVNAAGDVLHQIGDVNPDFSFGFVQNMRWKGFAVYALLDGVVGGDIYNFTKQWMYQDLRHGTQGQGNRPVADRRPLAFYSAGLYNGLEANSHFVENGTYARLRELSVAYNFSPDLLSRMGLGVLSNGAKLSLVGRNLLTFTDYTGFDPEATSGSDFNFRIDGFRYPNFRTVTMMLDVNF